MDLISTKMSLTRTEQSSDPFSVEPSVGKLAFLKNMTHAELEQILRIYYPIIKLEPKTYMIGLERVKIIHKGENLIIKTILGYITLEAMIGLDCLDDCLILAKTCDDLLKPFKQVVLIHLRGHKASDEIIKKYEESQGLNGEILKEIIKQL